MTDETDSQGGFLNRWSARKRRTLQPATDAFETLDSDSRDVDNPAASQDPSESILHTDLHSDSLIHNDDLPVAVAAPDDKPQVAAEFEPEEEPLLSDADMPPIESLTAESDVSAFFNRGVSAALRRAALRHVFHQPAFNVRDGLNDYDGDYTVFEPLGDTITSDMKWHTARKERERLEAQALEQEQREAEELKASENESAEADAQTSDEPDTDASESEAQDLTEQESCGQETVAQDSTVKGLSETQTVGNDDIAASDSGRDTCHQSAVDKIKARDT